MHRRHFLQTIVAAAGVASMSARAADEYASAFAASRASKPWTLGYVGLQADVEPMPLTLRGRIPAGLTGAFYRNGPARHTLGGQRYHHLFDGDGMVQKYSLSERGVVHQGRFVRTEKFRADSAAG